jgi:hypothetical protein
VSEEIVLVLLLDALPTGYVAVLFWTACTLLSAIAVAHVWQWRRERGLA